MNKGLYGYNGLIEHKTKKNKTRKIKLSITGFILMIIAFIVFIFTFIILNKLNTNDSREKPIGYSKEEFIDVIKDKAIDNYKEYGILPSVTIAQAILESSYGNSKLAKWMLG